MTSFIKVFAVILCLHVVILVFQYTVAGTTAKKNPFGLIKNMIPLTPPLSALSPPPPPSP